MRVLILAGGLGTRISEETDLRPKPMVQIGSHPILYHLMNSFSQQGFTDFVIALGYKSLVIKNYFKDLCELEGDLYFDLSKKSFSQLGSFNEETWRVTLQETGLNTQTGGRIRKVMLDNPGEKFLVTYGDGLSNVNLQDLITFHEESQGLATITAVHPPGRFGSLTLSGNKVSKFEEKDDYSTSWINGGWIIVEPKVLDYIHADSDSFEFDVLPRLAGTGELNAFKHSGFWQPMDTLRDKNVLNELANQEKPPWYL
jgi:glucose-1-phosphate cytidylyltransferase